jgi:hypothetical protein
MSAVGSRRGRMAAGVIGLWVGGLALLAKKELFRPHMEKLGEAGLSVSPLCASCHACCSASVERSGRGAASARSSDEGTGRS